MRLFLLLTSFLSFNALSAPPNCTEADLVPGDQIGVCTSLTINNPVVIAPANGLNRIYITGITGNVEIKANITIDGGVGGSDVGPFAGGNGLGGPGAHDGGGNGFGGPEDGGTSSVPDGKLANNENPCASGGGGAGFASAGSKGSECTTSTIQANGGGAAVAPVFDFTFADFRGGFGGGAGGEGASTQLGAGGGGGGALHIEATGMITIASGVTISAKGGNGGASTNDGGGGGGGSGGAVWLISTAGIVNNGTINVSGGSGGASAAGGNGGSGSSGRIRLESAGVVTNATDVLSSGAALARPKLTSDISCGTVSHKNKDNNFFTMIAGFFLITLLSKLLPGLSRRKVFKS